MKSLSPATRAIELFTVTRELGPLVSSQMMLVFVTISAMNDASAGVRTRDVEKRLGLISSSMSRNIQALGSKHIVSRDPGLGLITQAPDPDDNRAQLLFLTGKGRRLWDRIKSIMEG